jgi:predicted alpha/beta superfamily hydrolase
MKFLSLAVACLALATVADAQGVQAFSAYHVEQHDLRSSVNHSDYRLFVSLPDRPPNDTARYPVLYVLDGEINFPLILGIRGFLQGTSIPRVIVVGIAYPDSSNWDIRRHLELTPSSSPSADSIYKPEYARLGEDTTHLRSGGAAQFLETLRRDIIPFVERTYRTTNDRGLLGHSFGGLFATYALHSAPDLFSRYGIFSPSTWWNNNETVRALARTNAAGTLTGARVFVGAGTNEELGMQAQADSVAMILKRTYGTRLALEERRFPGTHASYFPEAASVGLAFLYADPSGCTEMVASVGGRRYVLLNGEDTISIEHFVRRGATISGQLRQVTGACVKYELSVDASGKISGTRLVDQRLSEKPRTVTSTLRGSRVAVRISEPPRDTSFDTHERTVLYVPSIIASLEQAIREPRLRIGDSTGMFTTNFRHGGTATGVITRISADSFRVRSANTDIRVRVNGRREVTGGTVSNGPGVRWLLVRQGDK